MVVEGTALLEYFNKLTLRLLTGRRTVDSEAVYQKVHVRPWDRPR